MDALALLRNAVTLHRQGRLQAACDLYGRVLALRPDLAEAALLLGLAGLELEDFDAAEAAFARAVALAPQDAEAHHGLGAARLALGRPAEAEADQRRAVALAPGCAPAWDGLGGALLAQDRPEEAMAAYAQALALIPDHDPEQIGTLNNLGAACKAAGRPAEALAHYDRVLALRPDDPDIRCNRANAALDLGDAEAALADFQAACAADPEHAAARWGACFARLPVGFEAEADIAPAR
ncbi:MAG: tetratricopeptide repeat protein, partial [Desulfovibrionaceae bacterium]